MIEIKDIEIVYDDYIILNKTDIDIPEHAITLIRGVSGIFIISYRTDK